MATAGTVALVFLLVWWAPVDVRAQAPPARKPALVDAVAGNPTAAPQLAAQEVAAGAPDGAAPIVGEVVGALPSGHLLSLAPRVVQAAIAALAAPQRAVQAPACACAAIRAVPPSEKPAVVPAIVAAAVAMAPAARRQIVTCALEASPELASAIVAAAGPAGIQPELANPPTSPLPGSTIGRDVLFNTATQICASSPCP